MKEKFWLYPTKNYTLSQKEILKGSKLLFATILSCSILSSPILGGRIGLDKNPTLDLDSDVSSILHEKGLRRMVAHQPREPKLIELENIGVFSKEKYNVPKEALEKTRLCGCLPHRCECLTHNDAISKAAAIDMKYTVQVWAKSFSAPDEHKEVYDYYDIMLILGLNHSDNLASTKFLPKSFKVSASPVMEANDGKWKDLSQDMYHLPDPLFWHPQQIVGEMSFEHTRGYGLNITGGFPTGVTAGANYAASHSYRRNSKDIDIIPNFNKPNNVLWEIEYNNLHLKGGKKGFLPRGAMQERFRWLWQIKKNDGEEGENKFYETQNTPDNTGKFLNFKVELKASFENMRLGKKQTSELLIFDPNDPAIASIKVPEKTKSIIEGKIISLNEVPFVVYE